MLLHMCFRNVGHLSEQQHSRAHGYSLAPCKRAINEQKMHIHGGLCTCVKQHCHTSVEIQCKHRHLHRQRTLMIPHTLVFGFCKHFSLIRDAGGLGQYPRNTGSEVGFIHGWNSRHTFIHSVTPRK